MSEVSCRILQVFFDGLKKKGLPATLLVEGVDYSLAHLQNKNERCSWTAFARVVENAERIWTPLELEALGGSWIEAPFLRHVGLLVRTLFTPKQFYEWMAAPLKSRRGSAQAFTCITVVYHDRGVDRLALDLVLDEGIASSAGFYAMCRGGFAAVPKLLKLPAAKIDLTPLDRGMRFDIRLPAGSDRVSPVRRAFRWFTAPASAVRELDDVHSALQVRYDELEAARAKVALQAAQLKTAHTISELIQRDLDLGRTLEAIAGALVAHAGFVRVAVEVDVAIDDLTVKRSIEHGRGDGVRFTTEIEGRGGKTGRLTAWGKRDADAAIAEELLTYVLPSIAMAVDNALSYLVVEEFRRGLELRVAERTAELSRARDDLAATVTDLEQAREVRDRIFANINHDLRSPLSLILLAIAEARRGGVADGSTRTLSAIEHGARRVLRMVDELLILAEGRKGEVRLVTTACDLGLMVSGVADAWAPAANAAGLTLEGSAVSGAVVDADPNALERILANLVSNAIKFTPRGGSVRVALTTNERSAVLEVIDDGPGIDAELKSRLFGRFERGAQARARAVNGSGLGLSLVKELTEAHGGSIVAEDATGGGALFRVVLPLSAAAVDLPRAAAPKLCAADYGIADPLEHVVQIFEPPKGKTPLARLLLAEDDPGLRERTARLLAEEYLVYAAPDGLMAFELAKQHSPDLLITDIAMPGMDGLDLTRKFRALPNNRVAPVLVLTTFGGVRDRLSGLEAGAVDYIHKPFEPAELRARVRSQLTLRSVALQLLETEKLAALGTLSAGLAHEIRNPANGIINAMAPLRELLPPETIAADTPAGQLFDIIEHCSKQVAAMSRQLLGFKRGVEPRRQSVPIKSLISRVCTTVSPSLEGIELREAFEYTGPIHCAEPLLAQVLTNLVQNGAHAAGRGGWVEVRTGLEDARVIVEVRDSGPGVPEDLRERIFEPFFTTKPAGMGTGLGLSTSREIVLRHGGSLDVRRAGDLTVFRIEIPLPS